MDFAGHITTQSEGIAGVVETTPDLPVPSCPDWTVADLAGHVGTVHRRFTDVLRRQSKTKPEVRPEPPGAADLGRWLREGAAEAVAALAAADPAVLVWTWTGTTQPPSWVARRLAQETAVHRWDAACAAGEPTAVPADLAVDGVDEFLEVYLPRRTPRWSGDPVRVRLERADGDQRWMVAVGEGWLDMHWGAAATGDADAVVRAPVSDLLLLLWRRRTPAEVEASGDRAALDALLAWPSL